MSSHSLFPFLPSSFSLSQEIGFVMVLAGTCGVLVMVYAIYRRLSILANLQVQLPTKKNSSIKGHEEHEEKEAEAFVLLDDDRQHENHPQQQLHRLLRGQGEWAQQEENRGLSVPPSIMPIVSGIKEYKMLSEREKLIEQHIAGDEILKRASTRKKQKIAKKLREMGIVISEPETLQTIDVVTEKEKNEDEIKIKDEEEEEDKEEKQQEQKQRDPKELFGSLIPKSEDDKNKKKKKKDNKKESKKNTSEDLQESKEGEEEGGGEEEHYRYEGFSNIIEEEEE